ncbi:non-canonical purine NTP diphosphatase [Neotamlana laminarinivorans]|uniref:dITP/XTP pyrophosphatase n=1 Tax=Neotamlana laminarinivorans TaxID=2883124 RepID=A0A9X1HZU6_9FLAO|nr:non-canonical purine NTP diphosphatase [Tamlana laminarinivorans]MCB4797409.1 non-canonical purine NTP diphosphatase [Tamlana laminarinivorans]
MKLVFSTNNPNKIYEVQKLIPDYIKILSLKDIGCNIDIPETQNTILGNAKQKANYIKTNFGYDCFADDTGLEVNELNGAPGVHSARYAGLQKNDNDNIKKLLHELKDKNNRNAQFKTVIALQIGEKVETFEGICKGTITTEKKGVNGFGYDPVFQPNTFNKTFAEMSLETKNIISHRAIAVKQLVSYLNNLKL